MDIPTPFRNKVHQCMGLKGLKMPSHLEYLPLQTDWFFIQLVGRASDGDRVIHEDFRLATPVKYCPQCGEPTREMRSDAFGLA